MQPPSWKSPPETSGRSFLGTSFIVFLLFVAKDGRDTRDSAESRRLGCTGSGREEMRKVDRFARRLLGRTVGELVQRRRNRHSARDAQHFLETEFLHDTLLDERHWFREAVVPRPVSAS